MMKRHFGLLSQVAIGVIFGLGLIISGMTNPQKILQFLDLTGNWDPSLIFVMLGGILVGLAAFYLARKRTEAWFGGLIQWPKTSPIDRHLVIGSGLFGIGWGIAGFCPGPAIVALGSGHAKALVFTVMMFIGMLIYQYLGSQIKKRLH
ncbi:DUF6691 family protein [Polynucleobacter sp. IMCC30063]|uniref:DUF6691 family protein n=1 Tax=Polynucleobacter sp. IMCC30063 TaxID=2907298 RepID=UPI00351CDD0B